MASPQTPISPNRWRRLITNRWPPPLTVLVVLVLLVFAGSVIGVWFLSTLSTTWAWIALVCSLVLLVVAGVRVAVITGRWSIPFNSLALAAVSASGVTLAAAGMWSRGVGSGTKAPPFAIEDPAQLSQAQHARLVAYAESLQYDSTSHRAYDDRILLDKDSAGNNVAGPRARIEPELHAYLNSRGALAGAGRVVARIWVDPQYRGPRGQGYVPLKLPPGRSYVWIDRLVAPRRAWWYARFFGGEGEGRARAVIIPEDLRQPLSADSVRYTFRPHAWETYSRASWQWNFVRDPQCFNVTCPYGCCDDCAW